MRIGGNLEARNLIAGNSEIGVNPFGASDGVTIDGNYMGTDRSGRLDRGNGTLGITISDEPSPVMIGGSTPNRIAFNGAGVRVF